MEQIELRRTSDNGWMKIHLALSEENNDVSRLWAPTFDMRIGSAVVKIGGIGGVGTKDEYRMRGYSRLVMEESTRYFTETGHDMAVLFGISDFYHKFGYAPAITVTTMTVKVEDVLRVRPSRSQGSYTVRPMQESDRSAVLDLYDANNAARTGTLVRPRNKWRGHGHGTSYECKAKTFVIEEEREGIVGYTAVDDIQDACRVGELGYKSQEVYPALLGMMVEQAQQREVKEFEVHLPPDHPFIICLRHYGGEVKTNYFRNADGMARIITLDSLFDKLSSLLSGRLRATSFESRAALAFQTDLGNVTLKIADREICLDKAARPTWTVTIPQMRLAQLVMGYRSAACVSLDEDVSIPPDAIPLLEALFPTGYPWMAMPDWF